jgi:hypothetical protein
MKSTSTAALRKRLSLTAAPKIRFDVRGSDLDQRQAALIAQIAERGISAVMKFCLDNLLPTPSLPLRCVTPSRLQVSMRKFVAVAWLLDSSVLVGDDGKPLTLDQLGKLPQLDCTRCALSLMAKKFGDQFKFRARVQKRASSKPNYAASAKSGWEKRRAREKAAK